MFDPIKKIQCKVNKLSLINPATVESYLTKWVGCRICICKDNSKIDTRWIGKINDNTDCVGVQLVSTSEYGTDGTFNTSELYKCEDGRGGLVSMNEKVITKSLCLNTNRHKNMGDSVMIGANDICCIEFVQSDDIKIDDAVIVKLPDNKVIYGCCRWRGRVNNREAIGFDSFIQTHGNTDGTYKGIKLFECEEKYGYLCGLEKCTKEMELTTRQSAKYRIGDIIQDKDLYGRILSFIVIGEEDFIKIRRIDTNKCNGKEIYVKENKEIIKFYPQYSSLYLCRCLLVPESVTTVETTPVRCTEEINSRIVFTVTGLNKEDFELCGIMRGCLNINNEPFLILNLDNNGSELDKVSKCLMTEHMKKLLGVTNENCVLLSYVAFKEQLKILNFQEREIECDDSFNKYVLSWRRIQCSINSKILMKSIINNATSIRPHLYEEFLLLLLENQYYNIFQMILNNILQITSDLFNDNDIKLLYNFICQIVLHHSSQHKIIEIIFSILKLKPVRTAMISSEETCLIFLIRNLSRQCNDAQGATSMQDHYLDENIQNQIIDMIKNNIDLMEINKPNKDGDTALVLACKIKSLKLMEYLISSDKLEMKLAGNIKAINIINELDVDESDDAHLRNTLLKLSKLIIRKLNDLSTTTGNNNNHNITECKICMDNHINVSFQCGHSVCDICSRDLYICPFCKEEVEDIRKLYLN